ncbi:MAG: hypothetical protein KAS32_14090 [Candidatus Peribacteraceae bacterium]|nr:hypothetical protein [Candidatus Peribacteraceae bacterium]
MSEFKPEPINLKTKKSKKTKTKTSTKPSISPYRLLTDWFLNSHPQAKLEDWVIKAVNPRTALCMFGNIPKLTMFLNQTFNNFDIMYLDRLEFYKFLKSMVQRFKMQRRDFSFYFTERGNKSLKELHPIFPGLKLYEISMFLELAQDDSEYESLLDSIGMQKYKKAKKTKAEKKQTQIRKETREKTESRATEISFNVANDTIKSWDDWKLMFDYIP